MTAGSAARVLPPRLADEAQGRTVMKYLLACPVIFRSTRAEHRQISPAQRPTGPRGPLTRLRARLPEMGRRSWGWAQKLLWPLRHLGPAMKGMRKASPAGPAGWIHWGCVVGKWAFRRVVRDTEGKPPFRLSWDGEENGDRYGA